MGYEKCAILHQNFAVTQKQHKPQALIIWNANKRSYHDLLKVTLLMTVSDLWRAFQLLEVMPLGPISEKIHHIIICDINYSDWRSCIFSN